jgi:hypothetical protein
LPFPSISFRSDRTASEPSRSCVDREAQAEVTTDYNGKKTSEYENLYTKSQATQLRQLLNNLFLLFLLLEYYQTHAPFLSHIAPFPLPLIHTTWYAVGAY